MKVRTRGGLQNQSSAVYLKAYDKYLSVMEKRNYMYLLNHNLASKGYTLDTSKLIQTGSELKHSKTLVKQIWAVNQWAEDLLMESAGELENQTIE